MSALMSRTSKTSYARRSAPLMRVSRPPRQRDEGWPMSVVPKARPESTGQLAGAAPWRAWRAARVTAVTELGQWSHVASTVTMVVTQLLLTWWLWRALYAGTATSAGLGVHQATTYALLGVLYMRFRLVDRWANGDNMMLLVREGTIAYLFLRPVSPRRYYLIRGVGDLAYGARCCGAGRPRGSSCREADGAGSPRTLAGGMGRRGEDHAAELPCPAGVPGRLRDGTVRGDRVAVLCARLRGSAARPVPRPQRMDPGRGAADRVDAAAFAWHLRRDVRQCVADACPGTARTDRRVPAPPAAGLPAGAARRVPDERARRHVGGIPAVRAGAREAEPGLDSRESRLPGRRRPRRSARRGGDSDRGIGDGVPVHRGIHLVPLGGHPDRDVRQLPAEGAARGGEVDPHLRASHRLHRVPARGRHHGQGGGHRRAGLAGTDVALRRGGAVRARTAALELGAEPLRGAGRLTTEPGDQPLSEPVSPPTICRCARAKKASAGTIDSAVNAKMLATFWEYCDWKVATPSGRVKCDWVLKTSSGSR